MRNFQRKRKFENIMHSKPVLALLIILALFFAWEMIDFMGKMAITAENRKIAENKVRELEEDKEKLSANIAKLKTESGIEETIREKFGLVKPGEDVIIIVEDKNSPVVNDIPPPGFFSFIKNWFK